MDSEHWISRLAAAKRFYAAQLGHIDGAHSAHLASRLFGVALLCEMHLFFY